MFMVFIQFTNQTLSETKVHFLHFMTSFRSYANTVTGKSRSKDMKWREMFFNISVSSAELLSTHPSVACQMFQALKKALLTRRVFLHPHHPIIHNRSPYFNTLLIYRTAALQTQSIPSVIKFNCLKLLSVTILSLFSSYQASCPGNLILGSCSSLTQINPTSEITPVVQKPSLKYSQDYSPVRPAQVPYARLEVCQKWCKPLLGKRARPVHSHVPVSLCYRQNGEMGELHWSKLVRIEP